ncbi:M12 family metallo-peptidase [Streptococcus uberis]|uniref:Matrixin family metalloprotease n=1 Tax=Streptococcus uberis TaxID=1349 RepID=A0A6L6GB85_STRUB|nr:M12 family metallo-peptidase [Streptococcus uberis]MTB98502.1 matrixin family metalloprotease [Streptococcus uberis]MTC83961.1 matrixin family metalloprotease [Streptococcus uberis]MTC87238.1 matrixin family metalloprotease [Streptococcus uberis]MTD02467.1 matrixin family metalloprotease [Streptococcus uberis]
MDTINNDNDERFEMSYLGGLSRAVSEIKLTALDSSDKFSKTGLSNSEVLMNSKYVVQLNTESLTVDSLEPKVLAHEIGHIFGLSHNDADSLMTTFVDDPDFTGVVSDYDATVASAFILNKMLGVN